MSGKPVAEINIINLALLQLHELNITSVLDDNNPTAQAAAQIAPTCRRAALRAGVWNFAKKHDTAAKITTSTPGFNYDSYYQLPNDLIKLLSIGTAEDRRLGKYREFDVQGRKLLLKSTETSVPITYIRDEEDVSLWDALFVEAVALEMAIWLCPAVTGDRAIQRELRDRVKEVYADAASADHQERPMEVIDDESVRDARNLFGESGDISVNWDAVDG